MTNVKKKSEGFTLLELIVVIALISLFASIIIASLSSVRQRARDTRRISDARALVTAIEIYRTSFGALPNSSGTNETDNGYDSGAWDVGNVGIPNHTFISQLVERGVLSAPIVENDTSLAHEPSYRYFKYPSVGSCSFKFAILGVKLEQPISQYKIQNQVDECYLSASGMEWVSNSNWLVYMIKD